MFMVTIPNNPSSKEIFDFKSLFYIAIRVEPHKITSSAQCFACQGFGHSLAHCGHIARCVKCGDLYLTKLCTKTLEHSHLNASTVVRHILSTTANVQCMSPRLTAKERLPIHQTQSTHQVQFLQKHSRTFW